jgi:hypothetical protein
VAATKDFAMSRHRQLSVGLMRTVKQRKKAGRNKKVDKQAWCPHIFHIF